MQIWAFQYIIKLNHLQNNEKKEPFKLLLLLKLKAANILKPSTSCNLA